MCVIRLKKQVCLETVHVLYSERAALCACTHLMQYNNNKILQCNKLKFTCRNKLYKLFETKPHSLENKCHVLMVQMHVFMVNVQVSHPAFSHSHRTVCICAMRRAEDHQLLHIASDLQIMWQRDYASQLLMFKYDQSVLCII